MNDQSSPSPDEQAARERKKRYKKSLNLPRTAFPMKANLKQNEPQSVKRWREADLYRRVLEARQDAEPYVFHDGPPYANGNIHVGHLLNKTLKDLVVRTRNMAGRRCAYVPGWDCHGLPIEHKVMTELLESGKLDKLRSLPEETQRMAVRRACHDYAARFKKAQASQMERLMTLADYDDPYLTMEPRFERATLEVFASMVDQGIVYRDLKPVHWSIANETALAEAELEYMDRLDPSIYVWFEAADPAAVAAAFGVGQADVEPAEGGAAPAFMIWTTTPWTLPANLLIAVHPDVDYALVELDGRVGVVAEELLETVANVITVRGDGDGARTLATAKGEALLGLTYRHPLLEREGTVVAADYVTLEDGTGLVHTAPGHGADDYATGLREGVPIYCPVQADGTYDDTVPDDLRGLSIWEANPRIIESLRSSGHLYHAFEFHHSYPHDWRSKTPVIFRATEQWFIAVDRPRRDSDSLRAMALEAAEDELGFVPAWGRKRLRGMLESRPDWCISRQRSWGLPIPAFALPDGTVFLTAASVRAVADVVGRKGSDAWFEAPVTDLLAAYDPAGDDAAPEALRDGSVAVADLRKRYDIFDVWFESGSSWKSVLEERQGQFPADLYLEGSDQHRGWFQSSLLCALGARGEAPFRTLLTHGFIVDRERRKMSKSGGNALDVEDLLEDFGADVCRWWVSSLAFENDIKVDREYFQLAGESYRKVRNTLRFLLSNLDDFDPSKAVDPGSLPPTSIDAWALGRAAELRRSVTASYEAFDFRRAHLALFDFCNDTLSAVYLDAVKDRLYCDLPDSTRRRATQTVLASVADLLATLLAPILPHTAEEAAAALGSEGGPQDAGDSVHLRTFAEVPSVEVSPLWDELLELRHRTRTALEAAKQTGLENGMDAGARVTTSLDLAPFAADLPDLLGVSRVELPAAGDASAETAVEIVDLRDQPRCERSWKRDGTVRQRDDGGWLSDRDAEAVAAASA